MDIMVGSKPFSLKRRCKWIVNEVRKSMWLYIMFAPVFLYYVIFKYLPMYGVQIAFKDYSIYSTIAESEWVGLKHFYSFFSSMYFGRLLRNTIVISLYDIAFGFTTPILLALLLNEVQHLRFKKAIQTISYLPHFISSVIIVSMVVNFLDPQTGLINNIIAALGGTRTNFLLDPKYFWTIFTSMNVWQGVGWGAIIYSAALSGVDTSLYEAAMIDGASRFRQICSVTLPSIAPTISIMFILRMGSILSVSSSKIILIYNSQIYETADVLSTYVYRRGLVEADYSFASAVDLFQSVVGLVMVVLTNQIARKIDEDSSIW
ncbi:MAG: ABC transporter permease [Candidatus Merdivicinus sp.]|jgi:putative aldouronate transport system permease protein